MALAPSSPPELFELVRRSGLVAENDLDAWIERNEELPDEVQEVASRLVDDGLITGYHAKHMLVGKFKGFMLGQYKILDQIGAGGMGVIYLGEHLTMKRRVALKVLPPDKAKDEESLQRFLREARIVAALDHINVVKAYDIDKVGEIHYIAMEYIEGESLEAMVRRRGPLPIEEAANYISQASRGLQHAHERGLVHRDIKPGNMLIDKSGTLKILDMGLARFFEESSNLTTELCNGSVIGTADYMAPEQAVDSHEVDIRADIYSLGVTFYTLLTGQPPYANATVTQKLLAHHMRDPDPIQTKRPDVPGELNAVVLKMMAKKADDRYSTPKEVVDAVEPWTVSLFNAVAPPERTLEAPGRLRRRPPPSKRQWLWPTVAAGGLVLVGLIIVIIGALSGPGSKPTDSKDSADADAGRDKNPIVAPPPKKDVPPKKEVGEIGQFEIKGSDKFKGGDQIERLALSPNEKMLAGGSKSGTLRTWNMETREPIKEKHKAHQSEINYLDFSPNGERIVTAGKDGQIKLWNSTTLNEVKKMNVPKGAGSVACVVFSPDGKMLFSGGEDGIGRFWTVDTGENIRSCPKQPKEIRWVAWNPKLPLVYTAGADGTPRGWDVKKADDKEAFSFNVNPTSGRPKDFRDKKFLMVAVSPDGKRLLGSTDAPAILLRNATDGEKVRDFILNPDDKLATQWCASFSGDGSQVVTTGADDKIRLWEVKTCTTLHQFINPVRGVPGCVITKDGTRMVTSSQDRTVRLWALP